MANATAATKAPRKSRAAAKTVTEASPAPAFETFNEIPKRAYTLNRPAAHSEFFDALRAANEGKSDDERVYAKFPAPSKGVSAAIKAGRYAAIKPNEFVASNRTVDGALEVYVTVAPRKGE
jgi:hypothetical protein